MQPRSRILDVYGTFVRELGGWLSIGALIELMAQLGVEPQAVRSATSRMKRRGLLASDKIDGLAGYKLTPGASEILQDGDNRIFRDPAENAEPSWVIALFSVPEAERQKRYIIRSRLARLGFAQGPAGSWFAPASVVPETRRLLERHDLVNYVSLWQGEYLGFSDLEAVVAEAWDFPAIRARYDAFMTVAEELSSLAATGPQDDRQAFVAYLDLVAAWRPLPYLDPGLPDAVTPSGWPGIRSREIFTELNHTLRPQAMMHFVSVARIGESQVR